MPPLHAPWIGNGSRHLDRGGVVDPSPGAGHRRGSLPLGGPLAALVAPPTPPARARRPLDLVLVRVRFRVGVGAGVGAGVRVGVGAGVRVGVMVRVRVRWLA